MKTSKRSMAPQIDERAAAYATDYGRDHPTAMFRKDSAGTGLTAFAAIGRKSHIAMGEVHKSGETASRGMFKTMRPEVERAVELLQSGDDQGLEEALSLLQNTVFSFSMRVCGQREDAEDTMQEVLVKSVPYLPKFNSPKALAVWLYKVAKNRCLMSRRKSKFAPKESLSLDELMPDRKELEQLSSGPMNPESYAIHSEQAQLLRDAVQRLPPNYRIVLVLRDMEGLTDEEVAEITGLRPGTVRVRLHRARLFVRKELSRLRAGRPRGAGTVRTPPRPRRCREMFAELSDYLDDQLDDSLCERLEKHLDGCEPCQAFLSSLESTIRQLRQAPAPSTNSKTAASLRKRLMEDCERVLTLQK
jgi:RNA polymerase sigma-70 factor (ECF subfamily)